MATTEPSFLDGQRWAGTPLVLKVVAACIAAISLPAVMAQQQPVQLAAPQLPPPEPQVPQAWRLEADVTTTVTATNNSGYTDAQQSRGDVIVKVNGLEIRADDMEGTKAGREFILRGNVRVMLPAPLTP